MGLILADGAPFPIIRFVMAEKDVQFLAPYVQEKQILSPEEAVRKMTSFPASRFGLSDRGSIRPGQVADQVLFDAATVRDAATIAEAHRSSEGIAWVLVGGQIVWQKGRDTGAGAERVLRGGIAGR